MEMLLDRAHRMVLGALAGAAAALPWMMIVSLGISDCSGSQKAHATELLAPLAGCVIGLLGAACTRPRLLLLLAGALLLESLAAISFTPSSRHEEICRWHLAGCSLTWAGSTLAAAGVVYMTRTTSLRQLLPALREAAAACREAVPRAAGALAGAAIAIILALLGGLWS